MSDLDALRQEAEQLKSQIRVGLASASSILYVWCGAKVCSTILMEIPLLEIAHIFVPHCILLYCIFLLFRKFLCYVNAYTVYRTLL